MKMTFALVAEPISWFDYAILLSEIKRIFSVGVSKFKIGGLIKRLRLEETLGKMMTKYLLRLTTILVLLVQLDSAFAAGPEEGRDGGPKGRPLRSGDRATLIGGTFIERLQLYGYVESELAASIPNLKLRNLGWSGDNVFGESRAVFGDIEKGYQRLLRDLTHTKPSVVVVAYGNNEAHQGAAGLADFKKGLERLLKDIELLKARVVICLPHRYEQKPAPHPNPSDYNTKLQLYRNLLKQIADSRRYHLVDLDLLFKENKNLTENGVHLTQEGEHRIAPRLATLLGGRFADWQVSIDLKSGGRESVGTRLESPKKRKKNLVFQANDHRIGRAPFNGENTKSENTQDKGKLSVRGLAPGRYGLHINGKPHVSATSEQWAKGVVLKEDHARANKLRELTVKKNELYFHRYRPQNETYLFLFRKHEQGNNAVEIPQFDPLVAEQESKIEKTRLTSPHTYELRFLNK